MLTLVLGGARSGKSRHAESLLTVLPPPWLYLATGQAFDAEMRDRIERHRAGRAPGWRTEEVPVALADSVDAADGLPVLVDCLTLWLSNLLLGGHDVAAASDALLGALGRRRAPTVLVGSEVGLGLVPDTPLGRRFRDEAGLLHQSVAARADRVRLVVAGLAVTVR